MKLMRRMPKSKMILLVKTWKMTKLKKTRRTKTWTLRASALVRFAAAQTLVSIAVETEDMSL